MASKLHSTLPSTTQAIAAAVKHPPVALLMSQRAPYWYVSAGVSLFAGVVLPPQVSPSLCRAQLWNLVHYENHTNSAKQ